MSTRKSVEPVDAINAEVVGEDPWANQESLLNVNPWDNLNEVDTFSASAILETKVRLIGVPLIVTKVVYRTGAFRRGKEVLPDDYASLEAVTAPERDRLYLPDRIERIRKRALESLPGNVAAKLGFVVEDYVGPSDFVVINDSSTGIKRQITAYLAHKHLILPGNITELPPLDDLKGNLGENVYDQNRDEWKYGADKATKGFDVQALFRSGLRISGYTNDMNQEGTATFYLA